MLDASRVYTTDIRAYILIGILTACGNALAIISTIPDDDDERLAAI